MPVKRNDVSEEALKERSYLWMARVFALVCVVTLIADIILYYAIESLFPLIRVQPFYISTQDKDKQVIQIARARGDSSKVLQEAFIRQYILARFGMGTDTDELKRRWLPNGTIEWMSTPSVYQVFREKYATALLMRAENEGMTRDVQILNLRQLPRDNPNELLWQAEIRVFDMSRSSPQPDITDWALQMQVKFGQFRTGLTWEDRLRNPLGFQVVQYGQQPIKTTVVGAEIKK